MFLRLRIVLKDDTKTNIKVLEKISGVKSVFCPNNQWHIIIGTAVSEWFVILEQLIPQKINVINQDRTVFNQAVQKKGKWYQRWINHFSEIFIPLIPVLVAGGIILGFKNILEADFNGSKAIDISFFKGLNDFLWIPAAAVFWFLPAIICWSIFKKMKGSQVLGIIVGLTLLINLPNLYELTGRAKNTAENLWIFNLIKNDKEFMFGDWTYPIKLGYTGQVIPALGVGFFAVYVERFLKKFTPSIIQQIIVPLFTILIAYTTAMVVIGPLGYIIGYGISYVINLALTNHISKYLFAPIFGFIYAPLVITGMHHALNAVMIQNTATLGGSFIFPMLAISNIAQGASCFAVVWMKRKNLNTKEVGILGILSIQAQSAISGVNTVVGTGFLWFVVSFGITIALSFALTILFDKFKYFQKFDSNYVDNLNNKNLLKKAKSWKNIFWKK